MLDEFDALDYAQDAAYTLTLSPPEREGAATELSIRVDDGADVVIQLGNRASGRLSAYLTVDQAEELLAGLTEVLRIPSDRTGAIDGTGPMRRDGDGVPRLR